MENRLQQLFKEKQHNILSVFFTAGFPHRDDTKEIAVALASAGADMIEIGVPFSDPVADGPTIQASNHTALQNGMSLPLLLEQVASIRAAIHIPIILMGYINPVIQYGLENFVRDAAQAGADGSILPDLPLEEYQREWKAVFDAHHFVNTFLISPTTLPERIRRIDDASNSFVYAVSASRTTGASLNFSEEQLQYFSRLHAMRLKNPFLVGFGISNKETFAQACNYGAGAIIGSAFIDMLSKSTSLTADVHNFVRSLIS